MKASKKKPRRPQARKPGKKKKKPGKKPPRLNWKPVLPWLKTEKSEPFPGPGPNVQVYPEKVVRKGDPKYHDITMPPLRFRKGTSKSVTDRS